MMALKAFSSANGVVNKAKATPRPMANGSKVRCVVTKAQSVDAEVASSRRQLLAAGAFAALSLATPQVALAAKAPSGFSAVEDTSDGYRFLYPYGWQEVSVDGVDVLFKDVIEPLESVSVTMVKTDKKDIGEYGSVEEVSETLAKSVLTAPGTEVKLLSSTQREDDKGRKYYELEFTATTPRYSRHQLAVVTVANGKLYTLTTGAGERRWGKMKDKLNGTVKSFSLLY